MKIKVESDKIVKAVKKLQGIEIVLESAEDAKEALHLILSRSGLSQKEGYTRLRDIQVSSIQKYETSAVDYKLLFLLEFLFEENTPIETKVSTIKDLQDFFNKI
jgi:hypothetical protein